jgi:type III secretory pathway component EscT
LVRRARSAIRARVPGIVGEIARALSAEGVDLAGLGLAWARATPAVTLVPAFGLRALPAPARAVTALALAGVIYPALVPIAGRDVPWVLAALEQLVSGIPVAIAAAVPLWAATMAGGLADNLRGAQEAASVPVVEGRTTTLGVPLALLASALFLAGGGPSRVALALATRPLPDHPALAAAGDLAAGIALAVAVGAPLLAAALVLEVAAALVARAASPAQIHALLAPLRAMGLLLVLGLVLGRIAAFLALAVHGAP